MKAVKRFSIEALAILKEEILNAEGNEVFALGFIDGKKIVTKVEVISRGNKSSVLALLKNIEATSGPDVLIHNHPSGFLTPSDNDLAVSSKAAEAGIGSYIVDNSLENVYVVVELVKRRNRSSSMLSL